ncbi:MAG: leucine-rich repeat protein [Bacteroidaceae bacterium]|nr:leucine-rich repeat protein [Bacteroidaceae bacterium]
MKKTLKLMLAFALVALGSTSAWAAELVGSTQYTNDGYQYKIKSMTKSGTTWSGTASVSQTNWTVGNADPTTITIKPTIALNMKGEVNAEAVEQVVTFKIVEIEENGFAGLSQVTGITFQDGCNIETIGAGAFTGTHIGTLDLSSTKVAVVNNLFGTKTNKGKVSSAPTTDTAIPTAAAAIVSNDYLQTVKFPATLTTITEGAFVNCTKLTYVTFATPATSVGDLTINNYAFYGTAIQDLDLTNTNLKELNPLFGYNNVTLRKVTLPWCITTLAAYALADQIQLGEGDAEVAQDYWDNDEYYVYPGGLYLATKSAVQVVKTATEYFAAGANFLYNDLQTIGKYALSNTIIENLDFKNCWHLNFSATEPIFVSETTPTNSNLQTVKLPVKTEWKTGGSVNPVMTLGITFANCAALTTIQGLENTGITNVGEYAFANDKVLPALSFPATVIEITGRPFAGCAKLATLNIDATTLSGSIGGTANLFDAIEQSDANTAWTFGGSGNAPVAASATSALVNLTITKGFAGTIKENAFYALDSKLANVSISAKEGNTSYAIAGTIEKNAIKLDPNAADVVVLGNIGSDAFSNTGASSIEGPVGGTATTLTIGDIANTADLSGYTFPIVSGDITSTTVGAISGATDVAVFGKAVVINFTGAITADLGNTSFINNALTTLNFDVDVDGVPTGVAITAGKITAGTFAQTHTTPANIVAPNLKTVNWHPADLGLAAGDMQAFDQAAFADATQANPAITLNTTEMVATDATYGYNNSEANLFNVKFVATIIVPSQDIEVLSQTSTSYYWGTFKAPAGTKNYAIDIEQTIGGETANITVYSAYVDENIIYVDPIAKRNGQYIVGAGQAVVVRSTKGDHVRDGVNVVKAEATDELPTMRYLFNTEHDQYEIFNQLKVNDDLFSSDYIASQYAAGKVIYFVANPASNNGLVFKYIRKTGYLPANQFYVVKEYGSEGEIPSEANLRVVILGEDGTEDPTFIDGVEVEETEATVAKGIYNLQGIRVNGSYKGIVIKDGKKYLQK